MQEKENVWEDSLSGILDSKIQNIVLKTSNNRVGGISGRSHIDDTVTNDRDSIQLNILNVPICAVWVRERDKIAREMSLVIENFSCYVMSVQYG